MIVRIVDVCEVVDHHYTRRREGLRRSISKANVIGVLPSCSIKFICIHLFYCCQ
jgi:hypothetical protein